jgi:predicted permease
VSHEREPLAGVLAGELVAALRALGATPRYTWPAVLSLALGIGAATAVYALVNAVLLRPLPFPGDSELVQVRVKMADPVGAGDGYFGLSVPHAAELAERRSVFASFAAFRTSEVSVAASGAAQRAVAAQVTPAFFDTLRPELTLGRSFDAREVAGTRDVVVLRYGYWLSAFAGAAMLGRTILIDRQPKTVIGMIDDERGFPAKADLWTPLRFTPHEQLQRHESTLSGLGRLRSGLPFDAAAQRLRAETEAQGVKNPDGSTAYAVMRPLREVLAGDKRDVLRLLAAAVGAFLLLACANVAALLVTRASVQAPELALRAALGASRTALARQSAFEAIGVALFGGAAGLALAALLVARANDWWRGALALMPARLDAGVLAVFALLVLGAALLVCAAPAWHARRVSPMASLRAATRGSAGAGARRLRQLLVALQVGASVALLGNALLILRSIRALEHVDPGYDTSAVGLRVLYPPVARADDQPAWRVQDPAASALARAVHERALGTVGVTVAALASDLPFDGGGPTLGFAFEAGARVPFAGASIHLVDPSYFRTLGVALLAGRNFDERDAGYRSVIINRSFAIEVFGSLAVLGRRMHSGDKDEHGQLQWLEIVGVVADTLDGDLAQPPGRVAYAPFSSEYRMHGDSFALVARGPGDPRGLLEALVGAVRQAQPGAAVYDAAVLRALSYGSYWRQRSLERVLGLLALVALVLAAIGLFGVTSYTVAERSLELGIRRALGASRGAVLQLIVGETAIVVGIGVAIGLGLGYASRQLLGAFLFGVVEMDPATFGAVTLAVALVSLFATLAGARAAVQLSPKRALARC